MIVDVTGIEIIPGNFGKECKGNGIYVFECCCDECDYMRCCSEEKWEDMCIVCNDIKCIRKEGYPHI